MNKAQVKIEKQIIEDSKKSSSIITKADRTELLRLKCRTDFLTFAKFITAQVPAPSNNIPFQPYKVHSVIGSLIQRIGDGEKEVQRSAISLPPRAGKSLLISKIFPAWQFGRTPHGQFIMSSYKLDLTNENARAVTAYVTSPAFAWVFPEFTIQKKNCNLKLIRSDQGGLIKIASANSNVTGFGYGVINDDDLPGVGILDDLLADGNSIATMDSTFNWTSSQFMNRMLPNYAIISMGTRFHTDDVIGRLLKSDPDGWHELNVPAYCVDEENDILGRKLGETHWPEMFSVETIESIRKNMSDRDFNALYMGKPQGEEGAIFKESWFITHEKNLPMYDFVYATIDTACKAENMNDYSAICIWGYSRQENKLHLLHYVLDRLEFPQLLKLVCDLASRWPIKALYIEPRSSGVSLIQSLRTGLTIPVKELKPDSDKVVRANGVTMILKNSQVSLYAYLPELKDRIAELCAFPYIRNNDFVDAFVYGLIVYSNEVMSGAIKTGGDRPTLPSMLYGETKKERGNLRETAEIMRKTGVRKAINYV